MIVMTKTHGNLLPRFRAEPAGAAVAAGAELIRRVDLLVGEIETLKAERSTDPVRSAWARLGVAHHAKRSAAEHVTAQAA
jgi:hypothetical protein